MKLVKLAAVTAAIFGTTVAMAGNGVMSNTAHSFAGGAKSLFKSATHPAAVSAEIGTMGYGANVAWGVNESTELQAGWSGFNVDSDFDIDGDSTIGDLLGDDLGEGFKGTLRAKVDASNPYLGVQMRPMKNWLTVGAGVIVPKNSVEATISKTDNGSSTFKSEGITYELQNDAKAHVSIENKNKLAPYATLGLRPNINNRWGIFAEVGAAYSGDWKSKVDVDGDLRIVEVESGKTVRDLNNAKQQFINDMDKKLNDNSLSFYPIAKAGITYRF